MSRCHHLILGRKKKPNIKNMSIFHLKINTRKNKLHMTYSLINFKYFSAMNDRPHCYSQLAVKTILGINIECFPEFFFCVLFHFNLKFHLNFIYENINILKHFHAIGSLLYSFRGNICFFMEKQSTTTDRRQKKKKM